MRQVDPPGQAEAEGQGTCPLGAEHLGPHVGGVGDDGVVALGLLRRQEVPRHEHDLADPGIRQRASRTVEGLGVGLMADEHRARRAVPSIARKSPGTSTTSRTPARQRTARTIEGLGVGLMTDEHQATASEAGAVPAIAGQQPAVAASRVEHPDRPLARGEMPQRLLRQEVASNSGV